MAAVLLVPGRTKQLPQGAVVDPARTVCLLAPRWQDHLRGVMSEHITPASLHHRVPGRTCISRKSSWGVAAALLCMAGMSSR